MAGKKANHSSCPSCSCSTPNLVRPHAQRRGLAHRRVHWSAPRSMQQIWTVLQRVGPNHLGWRSNHSPRADSADQLWHLDNLHRGLVWLSFHPGPHKHSRNQLNPRCAHSRVVVGGGSRRSSYHWCQPARPTGRLSCYAGAICGQRSLPWRRRRRWQGCHLLCSRSVISLCTSAAFSRYQSPPPKAG